MTYCPGGLTRAEIESVGFSFAELTEAQQRYSPTALHDGWNDVGGERVYYVSHPGLGLWALRSRFESSAGAWAPEGDYAE